MTRRISLSRLTRWGAVALFAGTVSTQPMVQAADQFIGVATIRLGPLANIGLGLAGGWLDYMQLLNDRDGGIHGVKLVWEECEFEYKPDRNVECYERLKTKGLPFWNTFNTPASYALTDRLPQDKIPLMNVALGRADAADGRVFPWVFPLVTTYHSANAALVQFIGQKEGGIDKLKGKKIAFVYHDTAFGKEVLPLMELQAKKYGFDLLKVPVAPPGAEQQSQWLQIRQQKPDWVVMRTLGVMTSAAIKAAQRVGFPADRMISGWWSGTTEDMLAAGDAAKGYHAAALFGDGPNFPVIQEIVKRYYSGGKKGNMPDPKLVGSSSYNQGVSQGIIMMEAVKVAMDRYGKGPVTGEQVRWALEHMNLDDKRIRELGATGLMQPIKTSCTDHEGGGAILINQWDGGKWVPQKEWVKADRSVVRPFLENLATTYAKEKGITPRDCSKER